MTTKSGLATRARISFEQARQTSLTDNELVKSADQLVAGKTYIVERVAEKLVILDQQGKEPPLLEQRIVTASMESLGRRNPIATLLDGKTLRVGEQVPVPDSVAKELFAFVDSARDVKPFQLTLTRGEVRDGRQLAIFTARIEGSSPLAINSLMVLKGELAVELSTCRVLDTQFNGPITMLNSGRSPEGIDQTVIANGQLQVVSKTRAASINLARRPAPVRR